MTRTLVRVVRGVLLAWGLMWAVICGYACWEETRMNRLRAARRNEWDRQADERAAHYERTRS